MIYYYNEELYHHGIKGQKWGIRRFQNADGSLTEAGTRRYSLGDRIKDRLRDPDTKKKIKKAAVIAGVAGIAAAGAGAYLLATSPAAQMLLSEVYGSKAAYNIMLTAGNVIAKHGPMVVSSIKGAANKVGKAMSEAALASIGTVAIARLQQKLIDPDADEATKERNQILFDTASAGINAATGGTSSSGNSNNKSGSNVGKEVTDKLGAPTNKPIDKSGTEYQSLFKDKNGNNRDDSVRSTIKSLSKAGYDIDQLKEYVNGIDNGTIKHSDLDAGYFYSLGMMEYDYDLLF